MAEKYSEEQKQQWLENRKLPAEQVISRVRVRFPELIQNLEIVGSWVWAEFTEMPAEDVRNFLSALGFKWNSGRHAWQHPCGVFRPKMNHGDPREFYGVERVED